MYSLVQSRRIRGSAGEALPQPFKALKAKGTFFRRGQFTLICAGPGTGKSALVLSYALQASVPTFYQSCDSDAFTQLQRAISIKTGCTLEEAAKAVLSNNLKGFDSELSGVPIRFDYNASPSLTDIEDALASYDEVYGDFPSLIVVDNITNVRTGGDANNEDPFGGLEALCDYLHDLTRTTQACVVGLHHVTGGYNDAEKPIPLSGVKGQITRVPEMVLTLHKKQGADWGSDTLCVSTVKNRGGKADPTGQDYAELRFTGDTMTIEDF